MLQRGGTVVRVDNVAGLGLELGNPLGKLQAVGDGGGQEDIPHL